MSGSAGRSTRREFMRRGIQAGSAAALVAPGLTAAAYGRAAGAGERIRVGLIGCGARNNWHTEWVYRVARVQPAEIVAICDIWRQQRERIAGMVQERFNAAPRQYDDYRALLDQQDIDAVIISTPDHQHCTMLIDAIRADKDVYIEKPIAMEIDELNEAYDVVKASKAIVQHGTQGRSDRGAAGARDFVQDGRLGKLLRVEESRSMYNPYWNGYRGPEREQDTNWKAFLFNRPDRPFDSDQHGAWMGYRDFSSGPVGGWMSHLSDLVHFVTGCGLPRTAVAQGGIYSPTSVRGRTCPDTITAIVEYAEGFTTCYTTHFGNGANDYVLWFGTKGTMRTGAPDGFPNGIQPRVSGEGSEHPERIEGEIALDNTTDEVHMVNWLRCVRERRQPLADMDAGYAHGVAAILADRAFAEGRKMLFDAERRAIRPA